MSDVDFRPVQISELLEAGAVLQHAPLQARSTLPAEAVAQATAEASVRPPQAMKGPLVGDAGLMPRPHGLFAEKYRRA